MRRLFYNLRLSAVMHPSKDGCWQIWNFGMCPCTNIVCNAVIRHVILNKIVKLKLSECAYSSLCALNVCNFSRYIFMLPNSRNCVGFLLVTYILQIRGANAVVNIGSELQGKGISTATFSPKASTVISFKVFVRLSSARALCSDLLPLCK